jgi:hypothetical protein
VLATEVKAPLGLGWMDYGVAPEHIDRVAQNVETGAPIGPVTNLFMKRVLGKPWSEVLRMSNDPRFLGAVVPSANVVVTARDVAVFYQCIMDRLPSELLLGAAGEECSIPFKVRVLRVLNTPGADCYFRVMDY